MYLPLFSVVFLDNKAEVWRESCLCQDAASHAVWMTMFWAQREARSWQRDDCSSWPASLIHRQTEGKLCSVRGSWYFISPQSKCDQVVSQVILPWEICLKRRWWKVSDVLWIHNLTWYLFMSPRVVPYSVTELDPEVFVWGHRCVPRQADPLYSNKPLLFTPTVLAILSVGFYTLWWLWGFTSNSKLGTL